MLSGHSSIFYRHFFKRVNFRDFLFASMKDEVPQKGVLLYTLLHSERPKLYRVFTVLSRVKGNNLFLGENIFPLTVDPN